MPDGTELEKIATGNPLGTRYYSGIAVRDTAGLHWIVADHHGTPIAQIDPNTLAVNRHRSMPYGEPRGTQVTAWKGTKGYVGGTKDDTGLTHLGAREYDPTTGRFISVDPIMDLTDPQQWNAYTYSNNNPVTFSDPSGLKPQFDDLADQHAWQTAGGNKFARKKRLKGYFRNSAEVKISNPWLAGLNSFGDGLYDFTIGGLIQQGQLIADETRRGFDRWSKVLGGEWTVGQALDDTIEKTLPNMAKPWDPAVAAIGMATMAADTVVALANGDYQTAAENAGYLAGAATGIWLTGRALGAGRGCNSFDPDTPVLLADGTTKKIKDIEVGDYVLATDPESNVTAAREVTDLITGEGEKQLVDVTVHTTGRDATITATANHPFWSEDLHEWIDATDLKPGTRLRTSNGTAVTVASLRRYSVHTEVNNLTVADIHTYYVLVGDTPVLVHNEGGDDYNQALNKALAWFEERGFVAERTTIGKFGTIAGQPIGMQTADGKTGFRVEFDERNGAHINVWSGKEKGPHFNFDASESTVTKIQGQFGCK